MEFARGQPMCSGSGWTMQPDEREEDTEHYEKSSVGERRTARGAPALPTSVAVRYVSEEKTCTKMATIKIKVLSLHRI